MSEHQLKDKNAELWQTTAALPGVHVNIFALGAFGNGVGRVVLSEQIAQPSDDMPPPVPRFVAVMNANDLIALGNALLDLGKQMLGTNPAAEAAKDALKVA